MKKGEYSVQGGTIRQQFHSGKFSVVDVDTDVDANTIKKISVNFRILLQKPKCRSRKVFHDSKLGIIQESVYIREINSR
ncbi:hypothetical protein EON73_04915 [bacterium]|nr:MAG: hypothetical protein EON73_04915 [bacterium]